MDRSPGSGMEDAVGVPKAFARASRVPASQLGTNPQALTASGLLKRLRRCASLDGRFLRACFHALYTEHLRKDLAGKEMAATNKHANRGAGGTTDTDCQKAPEDALNKMLHYLDDLYQREKTATKCERILNQQYKQLEDELSQTVPHSANVASLCPDDSTFHISPVEGLSRFAIIDLVISAKEREQVGQIYDIHHHNYEAFGEYLPRLPSPLLDGGIIERVDIQLGYTSKDTPAITWRPY